MNGDDLVIGNYDSSSEDNSGGGDVSFSDAGFPTDGPEVVNYFFPVEVVIAGTLPRSERESIQAELIQNLQDAIDRQMA